MPVRSDSLIDELRRGERDAFARYYELYREPVYDFVRRMLQDEDAAVLATGEVFTRAYREILLHDDRISLRERTFRASVLVCQERLGEAATDDVAAPGAADRQSGTDFALRVRQALGALAFRFQAALLMHDVVGLRPGELAAVFEVTEEAAAALLFRARDAFRRAFEELSVDRRTTDCRLAEQTAVGAVGRSLSDDEVRRLDDHAGYCRSCRRTMRGWGGRVIGLALFLDEAPIPHALETTPVFGTALPIAGAAGAVAGYGLAGRVFGQIGRSLQSKAAAYALAAVCLALAVGLATQLPRGDRSYVVLSGAAPSLPYIAPSGTSATRPPSGGGDTVATSTGSTTHPPAETSARSATSSLPAATVASVTSSPTPTVAPPVATEPAAPVVVDAETPGPEATAPVVAPEPGSEPPAVAAGPGYWDGQWSTVAGMDASAARARKDAARARKDAAKAKKDAAKAKKDAAKAKKDAARAKQNGHASSSSGASRRTKADGAQYKKTPTKSHALKNKTPKTKTQKSHAPKTKAPKNKTQKNKTHEKTKKNH